MDWTSGYVASVDYTHGYYSELSPMILNFALVFSGFSRPPVSDKPAYLELGFGQGLSTILHAACQAGDYWGTDFNPAHAANAQEIAANSGLDIKLFDQSFEEFVARHDLPDFDYITLHGIWSWVAPEPRQAIIEIIRKKLKVGGVVYVSYNCLPGWAPSIPVRHLLSHLAEESVAKSTSILKTVDSAMAAAGKIRDVGARFFGANPQVGARLNAMENQDRKYLAHEFFNMSWTPEYFSEVNEAFSRAKLTYAGSANLLDLVDNVSLTADQQALLAQYDAGPLKETIRDFICNQQFRKDVYVRGLRRISPLQRQIELGKLRFILVVDPSVIPEKINTGLGEVTLVQTIYKPVISALHSKGSGPKTIKEMADESKIAVEIVAEVLVVLAALGMALPAQSDAEIANARLKTRRLSAYITSQAKVGSDIAYLPSPVTGGAVMMTRFEQMFLALQSEGVSSLDELARKAWEFLAQSGQLLVREGKKVETEEGNLAILREEASNFLKRAPLLKRLGVEA